MTPANGRDRGEPSACFWALVVFKSCSKLMLCFCHFNNYFFFFLRLIKWRGMSWSLLIIQHILGDPVTSGHWEKVHAHVQRVLLAWPSLILFPLPRVPPSSPLPDRFLPMSHA